MRRISRGFTIIELLVVVAVIGILATITLIGFNRYQADARDSQRSSQATIIVEALERYYDKNGEYPSCTAITASASTVIASTLTGLESQTLVAPQDETGSDNSLKCQDLLTSDPDMFAYVGDGSTVCSTGNACLQYTLKYKEESTGTIKTITSRRAANILTSGNIADLAATPYSFSRIDLAWSAISGASSYNVQWKLGSSDFTTPTGTSTSTVASASVTGLTLGTLYYFRVQPATTSAVGNWSNTTSATTFTLDTPSATAIPDPSLPASQIRVTWNSVTNATSYSLQYSSSSAVGGVTGDFTTSPTTLTTTSPYTLGSLTAGTTRHFHVKAVAAGYTSGWSATTSATTIVPAPTCLSATTNSTTQITASWAACPVSVADNYTLQYATDSGFTAPVSVTGLTGTSSAVASLTSGKSYWFRVYALIGAVSSSPSVSPTATATTTISAPTSVSINSVVPGLVRRYDAGDWIDTPGPTNWYYAYGTAGGSCASGTTREFRMGANYNSPTTFYGWTGWSTTATKYMVQPTSGYGIRFWVEARCVGTGATSSTTSYTSGYTYN